MTSRSSLGELGVKLQLSDLAKGLDACIEIVVLGRECKTCWDLRRWAMALVRFVSTGTDLRDQMSIAKSYFARCREASINGESLDWGVLPRVPKVGLRVNYSRRELLHQISRVSRSLRVASTEVVSDSLKEHWDVSQCSFETPLHLRQSWRRFLRHRFGGDWELPMTTGVGNAASFLRKKANGGAAAEIKDITDTFRAQELSTHDLSELARRVPSFIRNLVTNVADLSVLDPKVRTNQEARVQGWLPKYRLETVFFLYDKDSSLSLEDWEVARELLFSLTACWFSLDFDVLPSCRQVAVSERGFKVRVATPLEAPFRYLLSMINGGLLTKLEELPQVVSALHGRPAEKLDWSLGRRGNLVFSADLKTATDLFPHDLMHDAADVLSEGWPQELRSLFFRAVGPHTLFNPNGESVVTKRGILMGSPVSWPLLSMFSAWLHKESGSNGWYAVCGDDYIGCHTYSTYRSYCKVRSAVGAIGSPGKDILGTQSVGVFAEELVTTGRCRWVPTVSVRAVLGDPKAGMPTWSQGPNITGSLRVLGLLAADEYEISRKLHGVTIMLLRRNGIDPFAPRWVGGAGFPGIPSHDSLVRARRMMSQSQMLITAWVTRFEMAWTTSGSSSLLTNSVHEDISRHADFQWDSCLPGEWGPLVDVVTSRAASLSWGYFLAGAVMREWRVSLSRVKESISSVMAEIAFRGYWVSAGEKIYSGQGLVEALQKLEPLAKPIPFPPILSKVHLSGTAREFFLRRKAPSGPGSPDWGTRKRARLDVS